MYVRVAHLTLLLFYDTFQLPVVTQLNKCIAPASSVSHMKMYGTVLTVPWNNYLLQEILFLANVKCHTVKRYSRLWKPSHIVNCKMHEGIYVAWKVYFFVSLCSCSCSASASDICIRHTSLLWRDATPIVHVKGNVWLHFLFQQWWLYLIIE